MLFFFSIVIALIDSILDDWGLQMTPLDGSIGAYGGLDHLDMDIDSKGNQNFKRNEYREEIRRTNSFLAMEVLAKLTENRKALVVLRLIHLNMYATSVFFLFLFLRCSLQQTSLLSSFTEYYFRIPGLHFSCSLEIFNLNFNNCPTLVKVLFQSHSIPVPLFRK